MKIKGLLFASVASLIIFASPVSVHCQNDSIVDDIKTIDGDVVSVNIQNSQIVVKASEVMTFSVPSSAQIVNTDGFGIQLSDVSVGNYVTVDYIDDKSGLHVMKGMEVEYSR